MDRRTRRRSSSRPSVVENIAATAQQSQAVVDDSIGAILEGVAKTDAAIVAEIMVATAPLSRLARIVQQVARQTPIGAGGKELIGALDELRYAIDPSLRPASSVVIERVWSRPKLDDEQLAGLWRRGNVERS